MENDIKNNNIKLLIRIIIAVVLLVLTISMVILSGNNVISATIKNNLTSNEEFTQQELDDMEYVDNKVSQLSKEMTEKGLSVDEKKIETEKLFKELKNNKYIIYYSINDDMVSFMYSCGVLGGIMLKPFDPMLN